MDPLHIYICAVSISHDSLSLTLPQYLYSNDFSGALPTQLGQLTKMSENMVGCELQKLTTEHLHLSSHIAMRATGPLVYHDDEPINLSSPPPRHLISGPSISCEPPVPARPVRVPLKSQLSLTPIILDRPYHTSCVFMHRFHVSFSPPPSTFFRTSSARTFQQRSRPSRAE